VSTLDSVLTLVNNYFHAVEDPFLHLLFLSGHFDFLLLLLEESHLEVLLKYHDLTGYLLLELLVLLV